VTMAAVETVQNLTVVALVAIGTFFLAVGTVGLLRFPNVYNRMHATSKPTTLGTAAVFLAGFVRFGPGGAGLASLIGIVFLFLTVPTGAHMISRAAQKTGVEFLVGVTWPDPGPEVDGAENGPEEDGAGKGTEKEGAAEESAEEERAAGG